MELKPAHTLTMEALAELFNEAFSGYVGGEVHFTAAALARFVARQNVDLDLSQIILRDEQPIGFGLISARGWSIRLASFGVIPAAAGAGVGKAAMMQLITQARQRGDRLFELEVIEQNTRAVRLYEGVGFKSLRRLVGYTAKPPEQPSPGGAMPGLEMIDPYEVAKVVVEYGAPDLPWQVAGVVIAGSTPPNVGYRLDHAYCLITDPSAAVVALRTLIVPPDYRRQGQAARMLRALFAQHPGKTWSLPAIFPEEIGGELLAKLGFERAALSQFQMRLEL